MIRFLVLLLLLAFGGNGTVASQGPGGEGGRDRAIVLAQTNPAEAIPLLNAAIKRNKKDVRAWHWLGVALEKQDQINAAAKAHENTAKIAYQIQTAPDRTQSLPQTELLEAADSAQRFVILKSSLSAKQKTEWNERAYFLRLIAAASPLNSQTYKVSEVDARARLLRKPEPSYSEDARKNLISGTVVLRCVFGADGRVSNIVVIKGLPDGLTERAIEAAKQIKFIPAMKDGKPVSMWMQLEYNFDFERF